MLLLEAKYNKHHIFHMVKTNVQTTKTKPRTQEHRQTIK